MVKGASIKFTSYGESVPKLLNMLKVQNELKKYDKIVLKPNIKNKDSYTPIGFVESVLKFCIENKNPVAAVFIAEGVDGNDTWELFDSVGYQKLAEKYAVGLVDINESEVEELRDVRFMKFESIKYPKILLNSCVISLPSLKADDETEVSDSLTNMLGAFPAKHYSGFFSLKKNKIRKWPIKYSVHDILCCKFPNFAIMDASDRGYILAGLPIEIDKLGAKVLGREWKSISHLKLIDESAHFNLQPKKEKEEVKTA
ncbi:MAG: DUF362 domain-containing protein [Nanoarchaeota archaeon]